MLGLEPEDVVSRDGVAGAIILPPRLTAETIQQRVGDWQGAVAAIDPDDRDEVFSISGRTESTVVSTVGHELGPSGDPLVIQNMVARCLLRP